MAKKPSPNKIAYEKELKRIKQFMYRAGKRGFLFPEDVLPSKPQKITKRSVERLKKINPESLYKKATYYDPIKGGFIKGTERRKQERTTAAQKAARTRKARAKRGKQYATDYDQSELVVQTETVLQRVEAMIAEWDMSQFPSWMQKRKEHDKNVLQSMLNGAIESEGRDVVARRCEQHATEMIALTEQALYDSKSESSSAALNQISAIILGRALSFDESAYFTDWSEIFESDEEV